MDLVIPLKRSAHRKQSPRSTALFAAVFALLLLFTSNQGADAQATYFWRSEATSGNWQSATGTVWWNSGASATGLSSNPATPVILEWANNNILSQTNNTANQVVHGFRLLVGASSARTFSGQAIRFTNNGTSSPSILHAGTPTHTISNNIFIAGGGSGNLLRLDINNTGGLIFDGNITNNGNNINIVGSRASAGSDIRFNGVISGAGGVYINNTHHVALFGAENTMSGQLTIDAGIARLTNSGSTFGGTSQNIRIADGTTLDLNNVSTTVGTVAERGSGNSGSVHLGSATLTVTGNDTNLFQGNISGTGGSLVKQGTHTLSLFGSQTYSGSTTVEEGVLATSVALATTELTVTGGAFNANGADIIGDGVAVTVNGGAYNVNGSDTIGTLSGSGGTVNLSNGITLTTSGGGEATYAGVVSGAGNFAKAGTGTLTLSGDNTFSGTTTVGQGVLRVSSDTALGTTDAGTTVQNGATLELTGDISVAENITITGNGVNNGGAIRSLGDSENTITGTITLDGNSRINAALTDESYVSLVSLGSTGWDIDISTVSHTQDANATTFTNAQFAGLIGGYVGPGLDWTDYVNTLAVRMTLTGANPDGRMTFEIFDSEFVNTTIYEAFTATLGPTPSITPLRLDSVVGADMADVSGVQFVYGSLDPISGSLIEIVGLQPSSLTISGDIVAGNNVLTLGAEGAPTGFLGGNITVSGSISGAGATFDGTPTILVKDGAGTVTLTGDNTFTGDTRILEGTVAVASGGNLGNGSDVFISEGAVLAVNTSTSVGSIQRVDVGDNGNVALGNNAVLTINGEDRGDIFFDGRINGVGGLTLDAAGTTLHLSNENIFSGATVISGGTLVLDAEPGKVALHSTQSITVGDGATLLIASNTQQVRQVAPVTLSGGTIEAGDGVSQIFGNLNVTAPSFIDFGTGDVGTLNFGTYTPSQLLSIDNFLVGNVLTFRSNLTSSINNESLFLFDNPFTSSWDSGSSTFTITAIPEPSTYAAAAGLLAMLLWPARRRLLKDAKSILGFRAPGLERVRAYRHS